MIVRLRGERRERRRLAEGIEHALERADSSSESISSEIPVRPEAVREARGALLDVAERLRLPDPVLDEGLDLARSIVTDVTGPLFAPAPEGAMRALAIRTLWALDDPRVR